VAPHHKSPGSIGGKNCLRITVVRVPHHRNVRRSA
jgi:hypothetical protein